MNDYLQLFLIFDVGILVGMALTAWFIGSQGCYEGCKLQESKE